MKFSFALYTFALYALYPKDTHQIGCRSAKFFW